MDYLWIIITIVAVVVLTIVLGIKLRNKKRNDAEKNIGEKSSAPLSAEDTDIEQVQECGIAIPIELLPATTQFDEKNLFEITDSTVVARISELIPFTTQTGTRMFANSAINSLKGTELVKMDIPFSRLSNLIRIMKCIKPKLMIFRNWLAIRMRWSLFWRKLAN